MAFECNRLVLARITKSADEVVEELCSVVDCEPIRIENKEQVSFFGFPIGTVLYTVEFADGSDRLVPESDLREP